MHSLIPPTDLPSATTAPYQPAATADVELDLRPPPSRPHVHPSRPSVARHHVFAPVHTTSTGDSEDRLRGTRSAKSTLTKWFVRWGPNLSMLLVILIGIASATSLYLWFHSVEEQNFTRDFESLSRISVRSLEAVMSVRCFQHLRNLAAFGYAVPELTMGTLSTFAQHSSFDAKIVYNLAFFAIVARAQQPDFEKHFNVSVWNSPNSDALVKSDSFLVMPVLIHPYEERATNRFFGWNALSEPTRRTPILKAIESNSWSISQPTRFKDTGLPGFITVHTMREREPTELTPFTKYLASVSIAFTDLFSTTLNQRLKSPQESDVAVYISVESGDRVFEYVPPQNTSASRLDTQRSLHLSFDGFSAKWDVAFVPTRRYFKRFQTPVPWVVLGSTLAVFVLLAYAARRGMARFIVSQQMMKKLRVQDTLLESLQEYSKAIIQAIPDGVVMLDEMGWVIGINDAALKMTGYALRDFAQPRKIDVLLAGSGSGGGEGRKSREAAAGRWDEDVDDQRESESGDEDDETDPLMSPLAHGSHSPPSRSNNVPANSISSSPVHARHGTAATTGTKNRLEPGNRQTRMRRKDGSVFIAQVTISNVNDPPSSDPGERPNTATATTEAEAAAAPSESDPADSSFSPTIDRRPSELSPAIPPQLRDARHPSMGILQRLETARPIPLMRRLSSANRVGIVPPTSPPPPAVCDIETQRAGDCRPASPAPPRPRSSPPTPPPPAPPAERSSHQLAQVYMFYDCTEKVETLRAVAQMEKQASEAAKAKHQLLEFLVHCMMDPLRQMREDMKAIHAAVVEAHASGVGGGGDGSDAVDVSEEEMHEASLAAEHIVRVLEDIAGFADITLASDSAPMGVAGDAPINVVATAAAAAAAPGRPVGASAPPGPGTLGHYVTSCILAQDLMDSLASRRIQFTANANPSHTNVLVPGILGDTATRTNVAKILRRLLVLGSTSARPDALMTMAVELQLVRQVAATGAFQLVVMLTVSHFDAALPQVTSLDMTQLVVSAAGGEREGEADAATRGIKFANIGLTWAAVLKMVDRMGGKVEQTRVSLQAGLVVVVTLPLPVAL